MVASVLVDPEDISEEALEVRRHRHIGIVWCLWGDAIIFL